MDLALNNQQRLICHKIQTNKQKNKSFPREEIWGLVKRNEWKVVL